MSRPVLRRVGDFIEKKRDVIIDHLFLLALAFIPFWRIGISGLWEIHDQSFPLYPRDRLTNRMYIWNPFEGKSFGHEGEGYPQVPRTLSLWYWVLVAGLASLGLPPALIQRFLMIFAFVMSGWGMYHLAKNLLEFNNKQAERIACIVAGTFYMMNPFITYWLFLGALPQFQIVVLPFILLLLNKGLKACRERTPWLRYALFIGLLSVPLLAVHPEVTILVVSFLLLYVIFTLARELRARNFHAIISYGKFLAIVTIVSLMVNLFWILPTLYYFFNSEVIQQTAMPMLVKLEALSALPLLMLQRLRLQTFSYSWYQSYPYTPISFWVTSPLSFALGFVLFSFTLIPILFKRHSDYSRIIFFTITEILYVGFSTGLNQPFGTVYRWLFDNFFFFTMLGDPAKFLQIGMFSYSVLLGVSIGILFQYIRKNKWLGKTIRKNKWLGKTLPLILCAIILFNSYPMLSGNFYGVLEPVNVPNYYTQTREWLRSNGQDFRITILPIGKTGFSALYAWAPRSVFGGAQPYYIAASASWAMDIFAHPQVNGRHFLGPIWTGRTVTIGRMLNLWNVKYLIIANDWMDPEYITPVDTSPLKFSLERQSDLKFLKSIGEFDIYENAVYDNTLIYGTSSYYIIADEVKLKMLNKGLYPPFVAFLSTENLPKDERFLDNAVNVTQIAIMTEALLVEDDSLDRWASNYELKIDQVDKVVGNCSVIARADSADFVRIGRYSPELLDLSNADLIKFWFKTNRKMKNGVLMIWDDYGKRLIWNFAESVPNVWQEVGFNLDQGVADYGPVDLKKISTIEVQASYPQQELTIIKVDGFTKSGYEFELPMNMDKVHLTYKRISPTKYTVNVSTQKPFILVLSEAYEPLWRITIIDAEFRNFDHFIVNGYANGWYIDKTGEFGIIIEYLPQRYYEWGIASSMFTVFIILAYLAIPPKVKRPFQNFIKHKVRSRY